MRRDSTNAVCDRAIAALAGGDTEALAAIYDCMARMIYSIAYGITERTQDAEDVLQDTLLDIARCAQSYRRGSNARAWILAIARHRAVDLVRRRRELLSPEEGEIEALPAEDSFARLEVLDLLRSLDEDERQIILLHIYTGLSHREIARMMALGAPAVQKRYRRALAKLRRSHDDE